MGKQGRVYTRPRSLLFDLLRKIRIDQIGQGLDRFFFVRTVCNKGHGRTLDDPQRENAQKTFGVDTTFILFNPNAAFKLIGLLNEESRRSCVQADLIVDNDLFANHTRHSLLLFINIVPTCYTLANLRRIVN